MNSAADRGEVKLDGAGVLITRPLGQAAGMEALVTARGGVPYVFPSLEISLSPADTLQTSLARVQAGDVLIFVSTNAVRGVFQGIGQALRNHLTSAQITAVGERTQAALAAENLFVAITPDLKHQNTEGLLHHPLLQDLTGRHVYIVRGQAGRETLREELLKRGAQVEYIEAYQCTVPVDYDSRRVIRALESGRIQCVMLTSFAAFENLLVMLGSRAKELLECAQLVVPSERIKQKIHEQFSFTVSVARNASDEEMLQALYGVLE